MTPVFTVSAGSNGFCANAGAASASDSTTRTVDNIRIHSSRALQVPRMQTRAGHSRSPASPIPASRTAKPTEVEGGRLSDDV